MLTATALALIASVFANIEQGDPACFGTTPDAACAEWTGPGNPDRAPLAPPIAIPVK